MDFDIKKEDFHVNQQLIILISVLLHLMVSTFEKFEPDFSSFPSIVFSPEKPMFTLQNEGRLNYVKHLPCIEMQFVGI